MLDEILSRRTLYEAFARVRENGGCRAVFLNDAIYLPFDRPKREKATPWLPPPLDLRTYLELRHLEE